MCSTSTFGNNSLERLAESKTEDKGKARMGSYPDVTEDGIKKKDNRVK